MRPEERQLSASFRLTVNLPGFALRWSNPALSTTLEARRRIADPIRPNPNSIIAQVAGSGIGAA